MAGCRERHLITATPQMDLPGQFWVRVLLLDGVEGCTVAVQSSFAITGGSQGRLLQRFEQTNEPINITCVQGKMAIADRLFNAEQITIVPDEPFVFVLNDKQYRGNLTILPGDDATTFDAVNLVPLEAYLAGVVGAEMPNYWEPQALRAQAIAARTYCLYYKKYFGSNRRWDVRATQANQVYLGVAAESPQVWRAVKSTTAQVLICPHNDGRRAIFPAYYCSTCGGHTENSKNVFGDSFPSLVGVNCPYCRDVAKPSFFFWPMAKFGRAYVTRQIAKKYPKLKNLGQITAITPSAESQYGHFARITSVKLVGKNGKVGFLRAEDLRLTLDPTGKKIRSTACKIAKLDGKWAFVSGRGYGHAVGMCQSGAQGMARRGKNAYQILTHYYPGSEIVRIY